MSKLVMGLGALFILMAVVVLVAPDIVVSAVDWESRGGQYLAGAMRIGIGLVLAVSAPSTRYAKGMRIFGVLLVVAGVGVLFIPNEIWAGIIHFWLVEGLIGYRIGGAIVGVVLGGFLVHASRPKRSAV